MGHAMHMENFPARVSIYIYMPHVRKAAPIELSQRPKDPVMTMKSPSKNTK